MQNSLAPFHAGRDAAPKCDRRGAIDGQHEAHRGAAFDAVDEHVAQFSNFALTHCLQGSNLNGV